MEKLKNFLFVMALGFFLTSCGGGAQTETASDDSDGMTEAVEASEEMAELKYSGETGVSVTHRVNDVAAWIEVYERVSDPDARIGYRVSKDDPNLLIVYELTESHAAAREMFSSEELKNDMAEAGVVGDIQITYVDIKEMNEEDAKTYLLAFAHEVEDYDQWKAVYDADAQRRQAAGLKFEALTTDADNPNMVYLFFSTDDLDGAMGMMESDDLKQKMQEAGVIGEPTLNIWVEPDTGA